MVEYLTHMYEAWVQCSVCKTKQEQPKQLYQLKSFLFKYIHNLLIIVSHGGAMAQ